MTPDFSPITYLMRYYGFRIKLLLLTITAIQGAILCLTISQLKTTSLNTCGAAATSSGNYGPSK